MIVGKIAFDGYGTYVRLDGDPQGLLVSAELEPGTAPLDWIRRELLDIAAADIVAVSIEHSDGERLRIEKSARADNTFTVLEVPEGRALSSEYAANSIASALSGLEFDDVRARMVADPGSVTTARYEMFDGRVIEIETTRDGDQTWAAFDFAYDQSLATRFGASASGAGDEGAATGEGTAATAASDPEQAIMELGERLGWLELCTPRLQARTVRQAHGRPAGSARAPSRIVPLRSLPPWGSSGGARASAPISRDGFAVKSYRQTRPR